MIDLCVSVFTVYALILCNLVYCDDIPAQLSDELSIQLALETCRIRRAQPTRLPPSLKPQLREAVPGRGLAVDPTEPSVRPLQNVFLFIAHAPLHLILFFFK